MQKLWFNCDLKDRFCKPELQSTGQAVSIATWDYCTTLVFTPTIFLLIAYSVLLCRACYFLLYYDVFKLYRPFCVCEAFSQIKENCFWQKNKFSTKITFSQRIFAFCKKRLLLEKNPSLRTDFFYVHIHRSINTCGRKTLQLNNANMGCYFIPPSPKANFPSRCETYISLPCTMK